MRLSSGTFSFTWVGKAAPPEADNARPLDRQQDILRRWR